MRHTLTEAVAALQAVLPEGATVFADILSGEIVLGTGCRLKAGTVQDLEPMPEERDW